MSIFAHFALHSPRRLRTSRLFPLLAAGGVWCGIAGCRSRGYNVPNEASGVRTQSPPGSRTQAELLSDLSPLSAAPPADYLLDTAMAPGLASLPKRSVSAGPGAPAVEFPDVFFAPLRYWNEVLIPAGRTPKPLAAATVLKALRDIRETYWLLTPTKDERSKANGLDRVAKYRHVVEIAGRESGCLSNAALHWSDLQMHYYCALPGVIRACYRSMAPSMLTIPSADGTFPPIAENRRVALRRCLDAVPGPLVDALVKQGELFQDELKAFYASQWVPVGQDKVNVFDAIMFAQTYAFDLEQEQAVINAFYADFLPDVMAGKSVDLSQDADACEKARPRRASEKDLAPGGHCRANKVLTQPLVSVGR